MNKHIRGASIATFSGSYFDFHAPNGSSLFIQDIAKGLANTCRFGGQCDRFYSVAEHSVLVSTIVPSGYEYDALMHDAAEAVLGDVPKPLKQVLPDYQELEHRVDAVMADRFGFRFPKPAKVKRADVLMLAAEQIQVMRNSDDWAHTHGLDAAPVTIEFWSPDQAYELFMQRFRELRGDV